MPTAVIAHRGASAHAPENTVSAFERARELGADGVELDVRGTADGALAVVHDATLADGRPVADVTSGDLPGAVCLLDAALAACGDLLVNVEIKADGPGGGTGLVAAVLDTVQAWGGDVLVSSFDATTLDEVRRLDPSVPTAQLTFLLDRPPVEVVGWVARRGHGAWHPYHATIDADAVAVAHEAGLAVNTWTVDDPDRIALLVSWGVDGIVSNDVPTARQAVTRP